MSEGQWGAEKEKVREGVHLLKEAPADRVVETIAPLKVDHILGVARDMLLALRGVQHSRFSVFDRTMEVNGKVEQAGTLFKDVANGSSDPFGQHALTAVEILLGSNDEASTAQVNRQAHEYVTALEEAIALQEGVIEKLGELVTQHGALTQSATAMHDMTKYATSSAEGWQQNMGG